MASDSKTPALSRLLLVEDDPNLAEILKLHLEGEGYRVELCREGRSGLAQALSGHYEVLVLDITLPNVSGLEICQAIQQLAPKPLTLLLTSRVEERDKILGLDLGADDYVTKPFSIPELLARIRALVRRRAGAQTTKGSDQLVFGDLTVDQTQRRVTLHDQEVTLTSTEFDLLLFFALHPGRAFSREDLLSQVWGYSHAGYEHTVNTHINRLRGKIEQDPARPIYIQTVRGFGYRFMDSE